MISKGSKNTAGRLFKQLPVSHFLREDILEPFDGGKFQRELSPFLSLRFTVHSSRLIANLKFKPPEAAHPKPLNIEP